LREYIYKENEIELIRHLRNNTPKKIWYNFMFYVFDYGNYHLTLECVDKQAKSQNKSDEAIVAELTRKNERYIHDEHSKLICENKPIDNIYIVRTFLYFSDFRNFSKPEKIANRIKYKVKSFINGKREPIDIIKSGITGMGTEYICHPKSKEAKKINLNFANLLDVGLLLEIENKYLKAFLQSNGFGFHIWKDKYFYETDALKKDNELYEFIKIEE
jgi:hypothetical protein